MVLTFFFSLSSPPAPRRHALEKQQHHSTTAADVNAGIKQYTATFRVVVSSSSDDDYGGDDDYGQDDDYPTDDDTPPADDDTPAPTDDEGGKSSGCAITDIRNSIGAVKFDCTKLESGAALASVGCPEGMQAVSIGCALFSAGFYIAALGATGIVQGDSASCAFPSRDLLEPEWSTFPYAMILNCAYLKVAEEPAARQQASKRLAAAAKAYEKALSKGGRVAAGSRTAVAQRQAEAGTMLWVSGGAVPTKKLDKKAKAQRVAAEVAAADVAAATTTTAANNSKKDL